MRFTEHELTAALTGATKSVYAARDRSVRKGKRSVDEAWAALTPYARFKLLDTFGDQLLPDPRRAARRGGRDRHPARRSPTSR